MAAAEKDTIIITATDSLKSCCLLGHTTSLSSSYVDLKKFLFFFGSSIGWESFSRGSRLVVGLVTSLFKIKLFSLILILAYRFTPQLGMKTISSFLEGLSLIMIFFLFLKLSSKSFAAKGFSICLLSSLLSGLAPYSGS